MNRLAKFITKHAKIIIALVILLTIIGITQIKNLRVDDDITKYLSENDPEIHFYQELSEKFELNDSNIVMVSIEYKDLFQLKNLQNFKLLSDQLEKSEYILSGNSFLNMLFYNF